MINRIIERLEHEITETLNKSNSFFDHSGGIAVGLVRAKEIIQKESKNNGWIPISERLPKPQEDGDKDFSDFVQICTNNDIVTDAWYCFSDGKWYKQGNGILIGKVIAWQPLPKKYNEV